VGKLRISVSMGTKLKLRLLEDPLEVDCGHRVFLEGREGKGGALEVGALEED
jgi:hypothetical protein